MSLLLFTYAHTHTHTHTHIATDRKTIFATDITAFIKSI